MKPFRVGNIGFQIRVKGQANYNKWTLQIGHSIIQKGVDKITQYLKRPDITEKIKDVFGRELLYSVNAFNVSGVKLPVYTGAYITSYIGNWLPDDISVEEIIENLKPVGSTRRRWHEIASYPRRLKYVSMYRNAGGGHKLYPNINTGGNFNPNMGIIYSLQFIGSTVHPLWWKLVEFEGWAYQEPYDFRAWNELFQFALERAHNKLIDIVLGAITGK